MLTIPFFAEIERAENILIAGAGGGFDIFSGLPLYFGLRELAESRDDALLMVLAFLALLRRRNSGKSIHNF